MLQNFVSSLHKPTNFRWLSDSLHQQLMSAAEKYIWLTFWISDMRLHITLAQWNRKNTKLTGLKLWLSCNVHQFAVAHFSPIVLIFTNLLSTIHWYTGLHIQTTEDSFINAIWYAGNIMILIENDEELISQPGSVTSTDGQRHHNTSIVTR